MSCLINIMVALVLSQREGGKIIFETLRDSLNDVTTGTSSEGSRDFGLSAGETCAITIEQIASSNDYDPHSKGWQL